MSIFKVARTSQPQGPVGIDWANPITKDLKAAVYVTEGKLCSAINPLIQGTLSKIFTTTPKGLGVTLGSTSNAIGYHTGVSASSNLTNLIYITGFVNTSSTKLMGNYGIGSLVTKTGTGQIICVSVAGGQFGATSSVLSQLPHVIVGTASASLDAVAIFIDGNLEGVGGGGGAPTADDSVGGVLSGGYSTQPFTIVMSLRWSRVLSNIEIKSLSDNPWQIFAPREINPQFELNVPKIYVPPNYWETRKSMMMGTSVAPQSVGIIAKPVRIRTSQPQGPARIDWANTLTRGFCAASLPFGGGIKNIAPGRVQEFATRFGASPTTKAGLPGNGASVQSLSADAWRLHSVGGNTTSAWDTPSSQVTCLALVIRRGNSGGNSPIFANSAPSTSPYIAWGLLDSGGTGALAFSCSAGGSSPQVTAGTIPNNAPSVLVGKYDGANLSVFLNGERKGVLGASGSLVYPNDVSARGPSIGNFWNYAGTRSFGGEVYLTMLWNRALSDAELKSLSDNPWQIFAPDSRALYGASS